MNGRLWAPFQIHPESAMVRATRSTRCSPRADKPNFARACASSRRPCRSSRQAFCASGPASSALSIPARACCSSRTRRTRSTTRAVDHSTSPGIRLVQQLFARQRRHFDAQVDAIEQRSGDARAIARDVAAARSGNARTFRRGNRTGMDSWRPRAGSAPGIPPATPRARSRRVRSRAARAATRARRG